MTRQRKEIQKEMDQLMRQEEAEYELGCGFGAESIQEAFQPYWEELHRKWAATYGMTEKELAERVFEKQYEAYKNGRIYWEPMNMGQMM